MTHFFKASHLEELCPSCTKPHDKRWKSEFWYYEHYKSLNCGNCGYKVFVKTDYESSGY